MSTAQEPSTTRADHLEPRTRHTTPNDATDTADPTAADAEIEVVEEERAHVFMRVLGDELRTAREKRRWTRRELLTRLGRDVSVPTVGTWETGTRPCPAVRVWQLCEALEISIVDLYTRVARRMAGPGHGVTIDLVATIHTPISRLVPLQAWAKTQRHAEPDRSRPTALLAFAALERMAELCELPVVDFIERLHQAGLVCPDPQASPARNEATSADDRPTADSLEGTQGR